MFVNIRLTFRIKKNRQPIAPVARKSPAAEVNGPHVDEVGSAIFPSFYFCAMCAQHNACLTSFANFSHYLAICSIILPQVVIVLLVVLIFFCFFDHFCWSRVLAVADLPVGVRTALGNESEDVRVTETVIGIGNGTGAIEEIGAEKEMNEESGATEENGQNEANVTESGKLNGRPLKILMKGGLKRLSLPPLLEATDF